MADLKNEATAPPAVTRKLRDSSVSATSRDNVGSEQKQLHRRFASVPEAVTGGTAQSGGKDAKKAGQKPAFERAGSLGAGLRRMLVTDGGSSGDSKTVSKSRPQAIQVSDISLDGKNPLAHGVGRKASHKRVSSLLTALGEGGSNNSTPLNSYRRSSEHVRPHRRSQTNVNPKQLRKFLRQRKPTANGLQIKLKFRPTNALEQKEQADLAEFAARNQLKQDSLDDIAFGLASWERERDQKQSEEKKKRLIRRSSSKRLHRRHASATPNRSGTRGSLSRGPSFRGAHRKTKTSLSMQMNQLALDDLKKPTIKPTLEAIRDEVERDVTGEPGHDESRDEPVFEPYVPTEEELEFKRRAEEEAFRWYEKVSAIPQTEDEKVQRAKWYIIDAFDGQHEFGEAFFQGQDACTRKVFHFKTSTWFRNLLTVAICVHILILFFEPVCKRYNTSFGRTSNCKQDMSDGAVLFVSIIDVLCVMVYVLFVVVEIITVGVAEMCRLGPRLAALVFTLIMFVDMLIHVSTLPYISLQFSKPLRPWMLVVWSPELIKVFKTMGMALGRLGALAVLAILTIISYSLVGVRLFAEVYPPDWESGGDFDTFPRASITLFVLLTTENYPTALYPAVDYNPMSYLFFWSYYAIMVVLIMSAIVGTFIDSYKETISTQAVLERKDQVKTCLKAFDTLRVSIDVCQGDVRMTIGVVERSTLAKLARELDPDIDDERLELVLDYCCDVAADAEQDDTTHLTEKQFPKFCRILMETAITLEASNALPAQPTAESSEGASGASSPEEKGTTPSDAKVEGPVGEEAGSADGKETPRPKKVRSGRRPSPYDSMDAAQINKYLEQILSARSPLTKRSSRGRSFRASRSELDVVKDDDTMSDSSAEFEGRCGQVRLWLLEPWGPAVKLLDLWWYKVWNLSVIFGDVLFLAFYDKSSYNEAYSTYRYINIVFICIGATHCAAEACAARWSMGAFNMYVVGTAFAAQMLMIGLDEQAGIRSDSWETLVHLILLGRVFSIAAIQKWAVRLYHLNKVLGNYWALVLSFLILMALVTCSFAALGLLMFNGSLDGAQNERAGRSTFNSMSNSMLCMLQIFATNNWNEIMFAVSNNTGLWACIFFIAYFVLTNIIIVNLFVALIADMVTAHWRQGKQSQVQRQKVLQKLKGLRTKGFFRGVQMAAKTLMGNETKRKDSADVGDDNDEPIAELNQQMASAAKLKRRESTLSLVLSKPHMRKHQRSNSDKVKLAGDGSRLSGSTLGSSQSGSSLGLPSPGVRGSRARSTGYRGSLRGSLTNALPILSEAAEEAGGERVSESSATTHRLAGSSMRLQL